MPEIITIGETMVLFAPLQTGPLRYVTNFTKTLGGAESNLAIAVAKLGHTVGWISRLGRDEFGHYIYNFLRGEGVDVSQVQFDDQAPTAVFFKERREGAESRVFYYRRHSAASRLQPGDIREEYLRRGKVLHVTGITPALSESCQATIFTAVEQARALGLKVSFDPNIRLKLWSIEAARPVLTKLAAMSDIFLPGEDELARLYPGRSTDEAAQVLLAAGVQKVVVKRGAEGCRIYQQGQRLDVPGFAVKMIDPIGAGDGFAAGFLVGQLKGWNDYDSGRLGNAVGAMAVTVTGDIEGYPTFEEVEHFMGKKTMIER